MHPGIKLQAALLPPASAYRNTIFVDIRDKIWNLFDFFHPCPLPLNGWLRNTRSDEKRKKEKTISVFYMHIFLFFFTAVVPVAAATMTPIPLLGALCYYKFRHLFEKKEEEEEAEGKEGGGMED